MHLVARNLDSTLSQPFCHSLQLTENKLIDFTYFVYSDTAKAIIKVGLQGDVF